MAIVSLKEVQLQTSRGSCSAVLFERHDAAALNHVSRACVAPRWLENCMRACNQYNAVVGANGRTVERVTGDPKTYENGWGAPTNTDNEADFVGHSWFFRTGSCIRSALASSASSNCSPWCAEKDDVVGSRSDILYASVCSVVVFLLVPACQYVERFVSVRVCTLHCLGSPCLAGFWAHLFLSPSCALASA